MKISKKIELLFVLLILIIGFTFRLWRFTPRYKITEGDVARDYLVAHHIVAHHEQIGLGPVNSLLIGLRNSPFYYYLLVAPLFIKDDIYSLGVFGVLLQLVSIISIWWFARILFGRLTAFICLFIYAANTQFIAHTEFMWQPFAAQPFFNISYALLALGYVKKKYFIIALSLLFYVGGLGVGFYGIPTIPIYLVVLVGVLLATHANTIQFIIIFLCFVGISAILYVPSLLDYFAFAHGIQLEARSGFVQTPIEYVLGLPRNATALFGAFLNYWESPEWVRLIAPWALSFLIAVAFMVAPQKKRRLMLWIIFFVLQPIFAALFFKGYIYDYYFAAVIGPLVAILSYSLVLLFRVNLGAQVISVTAMFLVLFLILPNKGQIGYIIAGTDIGKVHQESIQWVIDELNRLYSQPGYVWKERVNVLVYTKKNGQIDSDGMYWIPLERAIGTRLVRITNSANNYEALGDNSIFILVCLDYTDQTEAECECKQDFVYKHHGYHQEESTYSRGRYIIYLFTKE